MAYVPKGVIRHWSQEEETFLKENLGKLTYKEIGDAIGRSYGAVKKKVQNMGLSRISEAEGKQKSAKMMARLPDGMYKSTLQVRTKDIEERAAAYIEQGDLLNIERELAEMKAIRDVTLEWMEGYGVTPETLKFYVTMIERVAALIKDASNMLKHDMPTRTELQYIEGELASIILEYVPAQRHQECAAKIQRAFRSSRSPR